jgi:hypothetical protein
VERLRCLKEGAALGVRCTQQKVVYHATEYARLLLVTKPLSLSVVDASVELQSRLFGFPSGRLQPALLQGALVASTALAPHPGLPVSDTAYQLLAMNMQTNRVIQTAFS